MATTAWVGIRGSRACCAALLTLLCACDSAVVPPYLNPYPTKLVPIRVFAPATLKIQLEEAWSPNSHPFGTAAACNLPGGMKGIHVPIALRRDGTSYVGSFLEDRYLPSRCDWSFAGVFATSPSPAITVEYSEVLPAAYSFLKRSDRRGEVWCGIDPAPQQRRVEICSFLDYFAQYSDHFPQAWRAAAAAAVAPAHNEFNQGILFITPNTRSVELHYHDYDAEVRAANGNR